MVLWTTYLKTLVWALFSSFSPHTHMCTHVHALAHTHTHTCTCTHTQTHKRIEKKNKDANTITKKQSPFKSKGLLLKTILHINKIEALMVRQSSQVILSNVTQSNVQTTFYIHIPPYKFKMNTKHNLLQNNLNERYKPTINVFNQWTSKADLILKLYKIIIVYRSQTWKPNNNMSLHRHK